MWVLLAACGGGSDGDRHRPEPEPAWTAPSTGTPPALGDVPLDDGLAGAEALLLSLDIDDALAAYDRAMAAADRRCPEVSGDDAYAEWYTEYVCTSDAGAQFSGYGSRFVDGTSRGVALQGTVGLADGSRLYGNFYGEGDDPDYDGDVYGYLYLDGPLAWDGDQPRGTFIAAGIRASELSLDYARLRRGVGYLGVEGSATGLGGAFDTVVFSGFRYEPSAQCSEPKGLVSLRTREATWYDLQFQGARGACDGCAEVSWRGEPLGTWCGTFPALDAWVREAP